MTVNLLEQFADRQICLSSHEDAEGEEGLGEGSFLSCLLMSLKQAVGWRWGNGSSGLKEVLETFTRLFPALIPSLSRG